MAPRNNIWIAAADGNEVAVMNYLSRDPSSVNALDENGYTPLHAVVSYNHIPLLKKLILEHNGNVNLQDHDGDTPLYVAETVQVARVLVEELHADANHRNQSGFTAADVIEGEGDFPAVAAYLRGVESQGQGQVHSTNGGAAINLMQAVPPHFAGTLTTFEEEESDQPVLDEDFKRRIQELADRPDFESAEVQEELRKLVTEALQLSEIEPGASRNVRARQDGP